jgi:hypothetical protein
MGVKLTLSVREDHRLRVFENRVLRRIFGPKRRKWWKAGEYCIMKNLIIYTLHKILF